LADAYTRNKNFQSAKDLYEKLEDQAGLVAGAGRAAVADGNTEIALGCFEKIGDRSGIKGLAVPLFGKGDYLEAAALYLKAGADEEYRNCWLRYGSQLLSLPETLAGHRGTVNAVAISSDGRRLASGGRTRQSGCGIWQREGVDGLRPDTRTRWCRCPSSVLGIERSPRWTAAA
jgi:tetratricopeptide (TPR) repeat protein